MKRILSKALFGISMMIFSAFPVFAQAADNADTSKSYSFIAAGIGFAIAAGLAALGQSRVAAAACEGIARNPGAGARIQTAMILGLAFIETLVIFTLVIIFAKVTL